MASLDLSASAPRRPLDGHSWRMPAPEFALAVAPDAARFILRGDASVAGAAGAALGMPLSFEPMRASEAGERFALWLGPDEWLLVAPGEAAESVHAGLAESLAAAPHSLVDVSHRQIGLDVSGAKAARALNAGCPLDLSLGAFPVGMATRTLLAKCEMVLWRRGPERFHVEVWRSFADYAAQYLFEAARRAP
jgi:sarcosine oxidase, subunit gamma